ncbi:MAG: hypothetical protein IKK77_05915 [Clostridia bacterium]|nr:hypothetical protein [Clostridia bacterium]
MIESIIFLFVFFLSVIGLSELIHTVWIGLIKPKAKPKKILLCVLFGEFADLQLRTAYEEMLWHGKAYADELIAVDLISDEAVSQRSIEFAKNKEIKIIKTDELSKINITEF